MLGEEEWSQIHLDWANTLKANPDSVARRLMDGLLDLQSRLRELEDRAAEAQSGPERREAAFKAAREMVNGLPSEQPNARGYRDSALRPQDRVRMELDIARYLLGQEP